MSVICRVVATIQQAHATRGDCNIFTAKGDSGGAATKDQCIHFWCHDIHSFRESSADKWLEALEQAQTSWLQSGPD